MLLTRTFWGLFKTSLCNAVRISYRRGNRNIVSSVYIWQNLSPRYKFLYLLSRIAWKEMIKIKGRTNSWKHCSAWGLCNQIPTNILAEYTSSWASITQSSSYLFIAHSHNIWQKTLSRILYCTRLISGWKWSTNVVENPVLVMRNSALTKI